MKILTAIAVMLAFGAPLSALAEPGNAGTERALGDVDAILRYCVRLDPRLTEAAGMERRLLTGTVVAGRQSEAYRAEFERFTALLEQTDRAQASAACSGALRLKNVRHDRKERD